MRDADHHLLEVAEAMEEVETVEEEGTTMAVHRAEPDLARLRDVNDPALQPDVLLHHLETSVMMLLQPRALDARMRLL